MENIETVARVNYKKFKNDIKVLAEKQRSLKNQRKSVNLIGKREMPQWEATYKHQMNKEKIRIMYAAYGAARGISFDVIENTHKEEIHPLTEFQDTIDKIIAGYIITE